MTDAIEDDLRRALDDLLTVCWTDDIPVLDALLESVEDWTALTAAEFHESAPFDANEPPNRLSAAIATLQIAAQQTPTQASVVSVPAALADALADWLREHGTS
jgi:hypothetical protein